MSAVATLLTSREVAERLRISLRTLDQLVADGEAACVTPPYLDVGRGRRLLRWDPARINAWVEEVSSWRGSNASASRPAPSPGSSGGERAAKLESAVSGRTGRPRNSPPASSTQRTSAPPGSRPSLKEIVAQLSTT